MLNRGDPTSEYNKLVCVSPPPKLPLQDICRSIPVPLTLKIQNYSGPPTRCDARSSPFPSINLAWSGMTSAGGPCKSNIPSPRACSCTDSGIHKVIQDYTPFQEVAPHFCFRHLDFYPFFVHQRIFLRRRQPGFFRASEERNKNITLQTPTPQYLLGEDSGFRFHVIVNTAHFRGIHWTPDHSVPLLWCYPGTPFVPALLSNLFLNPILPSLRRFSTVSHLARVTF